MRPITIVLTEGFSDWEIAPLAGAGRAFFGAEIRYASPSGGPVTSAAGLPIADTEVFEAPDEGVVVVCGGPAWEAASTPNVTDQLRAAKEKGCAVAGICGGTVALAQAQLLDGVSHTSNGLQYLTSLVPTYAGAENYREQPSAVSDGDIITAPAPAPSSFAVEVLVAAGLQRDTAQQIQQMLGKEYGAGNA